MCIIIFFFDVSSKLRIMIKCWKMPLHVGYILYRVSLKTLRAINDEM